MKIEAEIVRIGTGFKLKSHCPNCGRIIMLEEKTKDYIECHACGEYVKIIAVFSNLEKYFFTVERKEI